MIAKPLYLAPLVVFLCALATKADETPNSLVSRVYPVAELVVPIERGIKIDTVATTERKLMERIVKHVAPTSWQTAGGAGSVEFDANSLSLLVRQTPAVHAELRAFLGILEKQSARQVCVRVVLVQVPDAVSEQGQDLLGLKWSGKEMTARLSDLEAFRFMTRMQEDRRTTVMQMPRITCFNGQAVNVAATESSFFMTGIEMPKNGEDRVQPKNELVKLGFESRLLPVIAQDGRHVQLRAELQWRALASSNVPMMPVQVPVASADGKGTAQVVQMFVQQPAINELKRDFGVRIGDGDWMAVHLGRTSVEARTTVSSFPVLARVPYVNRLFRTRAYGSVPVDLIALVSPRIVDVEDAAESVKTPAD
jgi:type II secretory pathway component GspD/PulD (secretin)